MLLPCPFCGGSATIEQTGTSRRFSIIACEDCGARVEANESALQTGQQWNRRVEAKAIPARSRQIDAALEREEKFDILQHAISPEGDVYLRATDAEWDRHILAISVRELQGYEQKYAEILEGTV